MPIFPGRNRPAQAKKAAQRRPGNSNIDRVIEIAIEKADKERKKGDKDQKKRKKRAFVLSVRG